MPEPQSLSGFGMATESAPAVLLSPSGTVQDGQNAGSSGQGPSYASSSLAAQAALSLESMPLFPANRRIYRRYRWASDADSPLVVGWKVCGLLNKLTMKRFESISNQIISWANRSEREKDGRTLIQVVRLVFERVSDEARSEMYARLCRTMMEQISPKVQDDGIKNSEGKPIAGGQLFRKYLLNRCQEDFERGWAAKDTTAVAAATKATEDKAVKDAAEKNKDESALYSEEYYAAQKARQQGLGLIRFIGELFKVQMLTERIMHECVKKLLRNDENPEEEEIESLCKLLTTVGQILDTKKAHAHMDVYFSRMKRLCKSPNVNSRMQFMLQDIIELRERKWIPRNAVAAPTTLAAVHEAAAKDRAAVKKETHNRMNNMSRGGSRRGGDRGDHSQVVPDGWSVAGSAAPKPLPPKAGDLTNFGKITKTTSMAFGPSSVFQGKKGENSRDSTMTSQSMFNALRENPADAGSKSSRPPSRKLSVDFGTAGVPGAPGPSGQRRKLKLLPRSKPVEEAKADSTPASSEAYLEDEMPDVLAPSMSEQEGKTRVKKDLARPSSTSRSFHRSTGGGL
ncbi:armadillo-type protein [Amylocystis lapponica]|nr:armadillo-type protein [Amylocystis lapponica]